MYYFRIIGLSLEDKCVFRISQIDSLLFFKKNGV